MEVREPSAKYLVQQTACDVPHWRVVKLGAVASFRTGPFGSALHKSDYVFGGVPVINPMQIEDGRIKPTERMSVVEEAAERLSEFRLRSGDVVIGRRGEMGRCAFVQEEQDGWLCGTGSMIVRPGVLMEGRFLQRVLSSNQAVRAIESASVGTTMINLNQRTLAELDLQIPISVDEQSSIADALDAADALIDSLEQLLTKKRQIKQGTMQELVTGKRRLPGFSGDWKKLTLRNAAEIDTGINKPTASMGSGALYVTVQDLYHGTSIRSELLGRIQLSEAEIQAHALEAGDIVFGKSSVKRDGIAYPSLFLGFDEAVTFSGFTYRARALQDVADSTFLFYWLRSSAIRRWLVDNSQSSALTNINKRIVDSIPVQLPALNEQREIAQVLSDMDTEIANLKSRLTKARTLKQAVAQALLAGRIRLI